MISKQNSNVDNLIFLAGMARSGTTWLGNVINYDHSHQILFEPFHTRAVSKARAFEYIQYLNPNHRDQEKFLQAQAILKGEVRNAWIDQINNGEVAQKILIKDVRCNLMLAWLSNVVVPSSIVLVVRHPLQVAASWRKMGWGGWEKNDNDLKGILDQTDLLNDFPIISEIIHDIDLNDFVQYMTCLWCINFIVPTKQLEKNRAHILFYENLLLEPEREIEKMFRYLKKPFDLATLKDAMLTPSSTNYLQRDTNKDQTDMINGWKQKFTDKDVQNMQQILSAFGLENVFNQNGHPSNTQLI